MILVTGGLGMIGAHTAGALADLGEDVLVVARRAADLPSFLSGRVAVETLDLGDRDAFLGLGDRHDIRGIVHLAGSIPGPDPIDFFRHDTAVLLNALDAARTWQVSRFAVASSVSVYEGRQERSWTEDLALPLAELPHAIAAFKKAVEPITMFALAGTGVKPVLLRIGGTWGPLMDAESPFNPIPRTVSALRRGERPAALSEHGDFCYAPDAGRAIALLATADALAHEVYNVSSGIRCTGEQVTDALAAAFPDGSFGPAEGGSEDGDAPHLDIARLRAETGFEPAFDVPDAIAHYVAWRAQYPR
ncbi:NAD-dependent epimerase/dehydratase family protein [Microbacterium sp. 22242]|uniref:NAD-dependent epimerase/dehydratase family protein n=1 Tax=Microbacterium sp. 22242 TaxID=3453896 RepID=UPI003F874C60